MGLFQKLFKRNDKKETIKVEVTGDKADVAPVETTEVKTTAKSTKTTPKTTTVTKQCAATTKAGTQCKRAPVGRSKYCSTHKN